MTWYVGIDQSLGGFAMAFFNPQESRPRLYRRAFPASAHGNGIDRLLTVEAWVGQKLGEASDYCSWQITQVAMEGYSRGSHNRREEAGELSAIVRRILWGTLTPPASYPTIVAPTQVKLFATGNGNATKDQVVEAVSQKWGISCLTHDEADAYTLARIAYDVHRGSSDLSYERKVIARLKPHTEQRAA